MWEEQDLGVDNVHGWFTHRDDSILSAFFGELLERSHKKTNEFFDKT